MGGGGEGERRLPRKHGLVAFAEKKFRLAAEQLRPCRRRREAPRAPRGSARAPRIANSPGDSYYNALDFAAGPQDLPDRSQRLERLSRRSRDDLGLRLYPEYASGCARPRVQDRERESRSRGASRRARQPTIPRGSHPRVSATDRTDSQDFESPAVGHDPEQPGHRAPEPGRAAGGRARGAAAGRGGRGLPPGPRRLHPRRPPPGLGHDPEQPGRRAPEPGRAAGGRARGRGGWPRRSRPTGRPSPSTPATTSPRTGPGPRTTWASRSGAWASGRGARRGAAAGRGGRRPTGRPSPSSPATTCPRLGQDPEQPGRRAPESGRAAPRGRGGWPRRSRPTGRPSPSAPATASPRMGHDPGQPGPRARGLGERQGGEGRGGWPRRSEAYRQALAVVTRDDLPQQWAMTQNNLGTRARGPWASGRGAGGARRLAEAVEAYRQAARRLHPRRPPPATGPRPRTTWASRSEPGRARQGRRGAGGWPRRSRPTGWPSPSAPATTSPSTGPGPRTTWACALDPGRAAGGPEGRGGWPRRSRPTGRPSPSAPATTSPRSGP